MNLFLVGPMGAGKTTIGRLLARQLGLDFLDSDHEIEERAGADISWIFDVEGEAGFRRREAQVIDDLSRHRNTLLATGGGAVLDSETRQRLSQRGRVIYLYATLAQQLERTAKDRNRPLLRAPDPEAVLRRLMAERHPLYQSCCDLQVETDGRRPKTVARRIEAELRERGLLEPGD